jgi:hypothetical protein
MAISRVQPEPARCRVDSGRAKRDRESRERPALVPEVRSRVRAKSCREIRTALLEDENGRCTGSGRPARSSSSYRRTGSFTAIPTAAPSRGREQVSTRSYQSLPDPVAGDVHPDGGLKDIWSCTARPRQTHLPLTWQSPSANTHPPPDCVASRTRSIRCSRSVGQRGSAALHHWPRRCAVSQSRSDASPSASAARPPKAARAS